MAVYDRWTRPTVTGGKVKRVRTAEWGRGRRWVVRWRDPSGKQRKRSFIVKEAAEAFWVSRGGTAAGVSTAATVGDLWGGWYASKGGLAQSTLNSYEQKWRLYVEPAFGARQVSDISRGEVAEWVGNLARDKSPATARRAFVVLSGVIRSVDGPDPTAGVKLPAAGAHDARPLTLEEVRRLAAECAPYGIVVWTLALTGIRWGEMAGARVRDLDPTRRRLRVARSISEVGGRLEVTPTKARSARDVPVPEWLCDRLVERAQGGPDSPLLPSPSGGVWRAGTWRIIWSGVRDKRNRRYGEDGAVVRAGLDGMRVHDLRHTAASLAIAAGADVKAIQRMLGHSSAAMTFDLYGHLWDAGLDDVAARLGRLSDPDGTG